MSTERLAYENNQVLIKGIRPYSVAPCAAPPPPPYPTTELMHTTMPSFIQIGANRLQNTVTVV
jgi:hypothetical protein